MDYGQSRTELAQLDRVRQLAESEGDDDHYRLLASTGQLSPELDASILTPELIAAPLLERLLVVEEAARLGLPALPGPTLLVGADVIDNAPTGSIALIDRDRPGPWRIPPHATIAIVLEGSSGWVTDLRGRTVVPVESSFGYPFGLVQADDGHKLPADKVALARRRVHLGLAAEIAGTASGALNQIADYLRTREQFNRPLSTFQALRHRVAELAVTVEGAIWLTRQAACHDDAGSAGTALIYGRDLAATMAPEVVQLCGARGFTLAHPAHLFAMRLEGLRLDVGSADRLAAALMAAESRP
jgi:alkylation response protein AidB-like acyl-CoA dehydrogenase